MAAVNTEQLFQIAHMHTYMYCYSWKCLDITPLREKWTELAQTSFLTVFPKWPVT